MSKKVKEYPANPYFRKFSSQIRSIKIFLPKSVPDEKYPDFVGRELLIDRLYSWLTDKKINGSFLVTGFRGMGKTTLVNLVTDRLTKKVSPRGELICYVSLALLLFGIAFISFGMEGKAVLLKGETWVWDENSWMWLSVISFVLSFVLFVVVLYRRNRSAIGVRFSRHGFPNRHLFDNLFVDRMTRSQRIGVEKQSFHNIRINVNLGHEVLNERDVLGLIANGVKVHYRTFVKSLMPHFMRMYVLVALSGLLALAFTLSVVGCCRDKKSRKNPTIITYKDYFDSPNAIAQKYSEKDGTGTLVINIGDDSWLGRLFWNAGSAAQTAYRNSAGLRALARLLFFALLWLIIWRLGTWVVLRTPVVSTPYKALKRLDTLCDRIVATTDEETDPRTSSGKDSFFASLLVRRRRKVLPMADVREIETELAEIINMIQHQYKFARLASQANFIIVFDEMDKIDPAFVAESKKVDVPEYTDAVQGFPGGMESRERRKNVLRLLANIKLFISSANAKFIFISGRELYDAYMADLSDRDFAISSIFSGVINVDSFLSPEGGQTDVRSMSEWYIANRLLPKGFLREKERKNAGENGVLKKERPSLRWYYEYLIGLCESADFSEEEKEALRKDASFVIGFLHTFAAYLTHISNGSPKKIFLYFEKYLRRNVDTLQMVDWKDECVAGDVFWGKEQQNLMKDERQVLFFDPTQQKTINFVYFLTSPIMGTITNELSQFGDRFLVSLSFVIDHIYKHHNRSFSWRNLEQVPDLLKTSKAPELREQVSSIMEYLTQIHITKSLIGLNEYKFRKSIAEEISIMSKMSDEASAIFNFTLDESLPVIQHNTRLLEHYTSLARQDAGSGEINRRYLPIIARVHTNLGDLHFWDEDYYSAALEYRAAVDTFAGKDNESVEKAGFLTKVRCSLKLGLTYEMRRLYPNAYMIYSQLIEYLIGVRWVDENDLGLDVVDISLDGWREKRIALVDPMARSERDVNNSMSQRRRYPDLYNNRDKEPEEVRRTYREQFGRELWRYDEDHAVEYAANVDGIISSFARDLSQKKMQVVGSLSLFEEVRYVYQAILAKLSLLEKLGMSGITQTNIDLAEGEFRVLSKSINIREKFIVYADFFRKLAEILYYKNSLTILSQNQDSLYATFYYGDVDLLASLDDYCRYHFEEGHTSNALRIARDVRFFFHNLDNPTSENPKYPKFQDSLEGKTLRSLYETIGSHLSEYFDELEMPEGSQRKDTEAAVKGYIEYAKTVYGSNRSLAGFRGFKYCDEHRRLLRKNNLRPPCYACKYYLRSLEVLIANMFDDKGVINAPLSTAFGVLKNTFRSKLLYTGSTQLATLAQTLMGYGNVMFSCASGNDCEGEGFRTAHGINPSVIRMLKELSRHVSEEEELRIIGSYEQKIKKEGALSRLDKGLLYYWDAYRVFLIADSYGDAVDCLNRIITLLDYYVETISFFKHDDSFAWEDEAETILEIIGDTEMRGSLVAELYRMVVRYTGYKYDHANLSELSDMKWIYSKGLNDDIDLTMLSTYPNLRMAFLRIIEMVSRGNRYLQIKRPTKRTMADYQDFIVLTYPLIAPTYRHETTSYDEMLGYYTKVRYNGHILNNIFGGNPLARSSKGNPRLFYNFRMFFYSRLAEFLSSEHDSRGLDGRLFDVGYDSKKKLDLIEYLIVDTIVCITNMTKVFTPHNHLTTYSKSFVGVVYNYFWEWSGRYEFLYSLYQFIEMCDSGNVDDSDRLVGRITGVEDTASGNGLFEEMKEVMEACRKQISDIPYEKDFGSRGDRFYSRLSHEVDDTAIGTVYTNYAIETALQYYAMAEETNTEGDAYRDMIGQMNFLNDDLNNDTIQFNTACDRFLLNSGIIARQREKLENMIQSSRAYDIARSYIRGTANIRNENVLRSGQFDHSLYTNSEC